MKKLFLVILAAATAFCLVPLATEASEYVGDYCWTSSEGNITLAFSVSFIGLDSSGYAMYDYAGRMITDIGHAPVNGNCIEVRTDLRHIYMCNLLMTSGDGVATFYAEFDFDTLQGTSSAIFNVYNGTYLSDRYIYPIPWTPVTCPKW